MQWCTFCISVGSHYVRLHHPLPPIAHTQIYLRVHRAFSPALDSHSAPDAAYNDLMPAKKYQGASAAVSPTYAEVFDGGVDYREASAAASSAYEEVFDGGFDLDGGMEI